MGPLCAPPSTSASISCVHHVAPASGVSAGVGGPVWTFFPQYSSGPMIRSRHETRCRLAAFFLGGGGQKRIRERDVDSFVVDRLLCQTT